MTKDHWIDDADHYICPICGFETSSPAKYEGCKCPNCGFQDEKDKQSHSQNQHQKNQQNNVSSLKITVEV